MYEDDEDWDGDIDSDSDDLDEGDDTVPCQNCGREVYEDVPQCPHCGEYIVHDSSVWANKSPGAQTFYKLVAWIVIIALLAATVPFLLRIAASLLN